MIIETPTQVMHQGQVDEWGQPPKYVEVPEPPAPRDDEIRLKLVATGLHRVVRSRASGKHYSSGSLPHIPGVDGIGTSEDGKIFYFVDFSTGSMAEYINVPKKSAMPLPEGVEPTQAAGIINPAMSSWMAFKSRTTELPKDFTVLILGATTASGRVAIHLARSLGAKCIIGAGRNKSTLDELPLDDSIIIAEDAKQTDFSKLPHVDVILDYVYGPLTEHLFSSLKATKPVQYVHIGALSALTMNLPAAVLRSNNLTIRGSGPGAWSHQQMAAVMPELLAALKDIPAQPVKVVELANVEKEWESSGSERVVFVP